MQTRYMTVDAREDKRLPIASVVDSEKQYAVSVKDVPDEAIAKAVQEIVKVDFPSGLVQILRQILGKHSSGCK